MSAAAAVVVVQKNILIFFFFFFVLFIENDNISLNSSNTKYKILHFSQIVSEIGDKIKSN